MSKSIYKITVINWDKHNSQMKRGHKATLIQNNFCTDAKLRVVPVTVRWLFLGILLTCGDHTRATIEMSDRQLRDMLESSWSIERALSSLKELQLLSYAKIDFFTNRIEDKRKERNRKETPLKGTQEIKTASPLPESAAPAIAAYCDFWKARYKSEKSPTILPQHAKQIKQLVQREGVDECKKVIEAYLSMPDSWFITKRHDIPTMMGNLNSITQFMETGKMFTKSEIRQVDATVTANQTIAALKRGDV